MMRKSQRKVRETILFYSILSLLLYSPLFWSILFYSTLFSSILFYSTLFYLIYTRFDSILLSSVLFYSVLFYSTLFYSLLFFSTLFSSTLFYSTLFSFILLYSLLFSSILLCSVLFHCTVYSILYHCTLFIIVFCPLQFSSILVISVVSYCVLCYSSVFSMLLDIRMGIKVSREADISDYSAASSPVSRFIHESSRYKTFLYGFLLSFITLLIFFSSQMLLLRKPMLPCPVAHPGLTWRRCRK